MVPTGIRQWTTDHLTLDWDWHINKLLMGLGWSHFFCFAFGNMWLGMSFICQFWKYLTCWHWTAFYRHCTPMSVKLVWVGAGGCALNVAGFDGFSLYCSGAWWAQGTVKTYWSQSESEGELVSLLQQTSSFSIVQFMMENCPGSALTKGISKNKLE